MGMVKLSGTDEHKRFGKRRRIGDHGWMDWGKELLKNHFTGYFKAFAYDQALMWQPPKLNIHDKMTHAPPSGRTPPLRTCTTKWQTTYTLCTLLCPYHHIALSTPPHAG
eukprot:1160989-Pelagomonas_calceolata.AAC.6